MGFGVWALPSTPAQAQSNSTAFWSQATVRTYGMPGGYDVFVPFRYGVADVIANSDPVGVIFGNANTKLYGDTAASATSGAAGLAVNAYANGQRLAGSAFSGSSPTSTSEVWLGDQLAVVSSTLPKGTPVTLQFNNNAIGALNVKGYYNGTYEFTLDIAGQTTTTKGARAWDGTNRVATSVPLTVKCRVGDLLNMRLHAYASAIAYFTWQDIPYGECGASGQMQVTMTPISPGVSVMSASGRAY